MKKTLFCLGLILVMLFSFAACGVQKDSTTKDPTDGEQIEDNTTKDPTEDLPTASLTYIPCKMLYWEISDSVAPDTQLQERVFSITELQNSVEYQRNSEPFEGFDEEFFKEKSLLIYRFAAPDSAGETYLSYAYTTDNGQSVTINAWYLRSYNYVAGNALTLFELNRNDYKDINVNLRFDSIEFTDGDVLVSLTKEATDATIFHDYTLDDFPEVNAESIEEIDGRTSQSSGLTYRIRQCLLEDPTGGTIPDHLKNYTRLFVIRLTRKSKENVLRTIDILQLRDDIDHASPNHIEHPAV